MIASLMRVAVVLGSTTFSQAAPADEFARIDQWVQQWQPTRGDRRFEEIGWAKDIPEAMRLAKQNGRPVFVFTHKGRINLGRQ
jgi:hypothetical protein